MASKKYGAAHRAERERWQTTIDNGEAQCAEPICLQARDGHGRRINPGEPWDLAHDRATGDWRGPAHARCNRSEGAHYGNTSKPPSPKNWALRGIVTGKQIGRAHV